MNLEIANRLVALRKENHLSQEALAERLGISRQAVSKWERAEASPDTDNLIALAKLYHVSLDELLKIHEEEEVGSIPAGDGRGEYRSEVQSGNETEGQLMSRPSVYDGNGEGGNSVEGNESGPEWSSTAEESAGQRTQGSEDEVHIGFQGIHVKERGGDEVHIGWDGIHVRDKDNEVHIDKHGIYVDGEEVKGHIFTNGGGSTGFPLLLLAIVIHITLGACFDLWWTAWLAYFIVPVIGSLIQAIRCRNPYLFAYPIFVTFIYLYVGLVHDIWHPSWIVFLTIPLYYSFLGYVRDRHSGDGEEY